MRLFCSNGIEGVPQSLRQRLLAYLAGLFRACRDFSFLPGVVFLGLLYFGPLLTVSGSECDAAQAVPERD
jgi:hypothetical protein